MSFLKSRGLWMTIIAAIVVMEVWPRIRAKIMPSA